jgi:dihydrofolate reductase
VTKISLIAAVAENGVIGRAGDLPWRIKSELQYFKKTTLGKVLIHGRRSFAALPGGLAGRDNIVITRDQNYTVPDALVVHSLEDALKLAKKIAAEKNIDEVFIAGGAEIYKATLPDADRLYLTDIHMKPEGDTFFPRFRPQRMAENKRRIPQGPAGRSR